MYMHSDQNTPTCFAPLQSHLQMFSFSPTGTSRCRAWAYAQGGPGGPWPTLNFPKFLYYPWSTAAERGPIGLFPIDHSRLPSSFSLDSLPSSGCPGAEALGHSPLGPGKTGAVAVLAASCSRLVNILNSRRLTCIFCVTSWLSFRPLCMIIWYRNRTRE
jgi:hypothetical protein